MQHGRNGFSSEAKVTPLISEESIFVRRKRSMKEITRKLYRKPVMLALALLVGAVVLVGVSTRSRAALPIIPKGDDLFETTGDGQTYHNVANAPIPAGTFTSNSGSPSPGYTQ